MTEPGSGRRGLKLSLSLCRSGGSSVPSCHSTPTHPPRVFSHPVPPSPQFVRVAGISSASSKPRELRLVGNWFSPSVRGLEMWEKTRLCARMVKQERDSQDRERERTNTWCVRTYACVWECAQEQTVSFHKLFSLMVHEWPLQKRLLALCALMGWQRWGAVIKTFHFADHF